MSMLRPEALAWLVRWRELAAAVAVAALGLWLASRGGYVLLPLGTVLVALGVGWVVIALRRLRFARPATLPGWIEIDEGQLGYYGPGIGGFVALRDLSEIRLLVLRGVPHWRLKQADGQALLIPLAAKGADQLYDAFATLPGIDMARLAAAAGASVSAQPTVQVLWQRLRVRG
ncbi:MAG: hypothetical protein Q8Q63_10970 [Phaeovulum sp.]|uniref:hypothetical protein n=1 Tax=Phaeovulum sp. TaxID=2934796 RepID=UPI00272F4339|nr:hypothetical protein [Phaeovulum sp.]MDP2063508.1 hypothetical protein [Phaeovulum sp.]MDP3862090.1 hypothetical protein [Phaeovulum sp.]